VSECVGFNVSHFGVILIRQLKDITHATKEAMQYEEVTRILLLLLLHSN